MHDPLVTRRLIFSAAAVAPGFPPVVASDRIAIFDPPPECIRIATSAASYVVPPPTFSPEEIRQIQSQGKNVELRVTHNADDLNRVLPEVDVVFGSIKPEMLTKARNLRWVQHTEAGMESVLFPELVRSPVVVTNMARVFAPAISETAIAMLLALTRGLNQYFVPQFHQRKYNPERNLVEVDGMTMGIVGLGGLGSATAMRAHYGFNMRILATDARPLDKPVFVDTLREPGWFAEMVPQVDICRVPYRAPSRPAACLMRRCSGR